MWKYIRYVFSYLNRLNNKKQQQHANINLCILSVQLAWIGSIFAMNISIVTCDMYEKPWNIMYHFKRYS